jgi:hypothetical protein
MYGIKSMDISGTKEYLKAKIDELQNNTKLKNVRDLYRGINDFKKGGDLVTDTHRIFAMYRKHFSQLLNPHGVNGIKQTEIHIAEPLVPEPSASEVEMGTEKLKTHKSPHTDQIPAELITAGVEQFDVRSINL